MKKLLAILAVAAFVASPAFANEAAKSAQPAPKAEASKSAASSTSSTSSVSSGEKAAAAPSTTSTTTTASEKSSTTSSTSTASASLPSGLKLQSGPKGEYLTTASGMTVYTYGKDTAGKSTCTGECAKVWPALAASSSDKPTGSFTIINGNQWAFNGKPLYTYSMDKAGTMSGASIPGWSVATIAPAASSESPAH